MNLVDRFLIFCRMKSFGSTEGASPCQVFSIAEQFSRFPAGRTKADGEYAGEYLREIVLQRLREGPLTVLFDGTMGYGSSFLLGAFEDLNKEVSAEQLATLTLVSRSDRTIETECWQYINSAANEP